MMTETTEGLWDATRPAYAASPYTLARVALDWLNATYAPRVVVWLCHYDGYAPDPSTEAGRSWEDAFCAACASGAMFRADGRFWFFSETPREQLYDYEPRHAKEDGCDDYAPRHVR